MAGYRSNTADRSNRYDRHGGDFKGIEKNFDYLQQLGITTYLDDTRDRE